MLTPGGRFRSPPVHGPAVPDPRHVRFLVVLASAGIVATVVGAGLAPPDPVTQLYVLGAALVLALPVAYLLAYRGWGERLGL